MPRSLTPIGPGNGPSTGNGEPPLYQQVKDYIVSRILAGDWPENARVPSENKLTAELKVSRMTVHRALRELTSEGWLERTQGAGTFVAQAKPQSDVLSIRNIAEEIEARGHLHSAGVIFLKRERARALEAKLLGLERGAPVFHSLIVHMENGQPVQLEDRYVNPAAAPDYLSQDFTAITPYAYLTRQAPITEAEHVVMAVMPSDEERQLLDMKPGTPCLLLRRQTWSGDLPVTWALLLHPGDNYRLGGRFKSDEPRG